MTSTYRPFIGSDCPSLTSERQAQNVEWVDVSTPVLRYLKDAKASLVLSALIVLNDLTPSSERDGDWFYASTRAIQTLTGLDYNKQMSARHRLGVTGFISERRTVCSWNQFQIHFDKIKQVEAKDKEALGHAR